MNRNNANHAAIGIHHFGRQAESVTAEEMASVSNAVFPLRERVPGAEGAAFDWATWYVAWRERQGLEQEPFPTHLKVEGADAFEAVIPWEQLKEAAVLFRIGGAPLVKGAPIRLYVPNGTSACLNVKSVVALRILNEPGLGDEAVYGFKNMFSPQDLRERQS